MQAQLWSARALMIWSIWGTTLACGDDPVGPPEQAVVGNYRATEWRATTGGTTTDQLAAGASITLRLSENGTTSGQLIMPGRPIASLSGTWVLSGATVTLMHSADTFLRDLPLQVRGNVLAGDRTFDDGDSPTRVQLTLTKQ